MTIADLYLKAKVRGPFVVIVDRTGAPIMRAFDVTPRKAIRRLLRVVEARCAEQQ